MNIYAYPLYHKIAYDWNVSREADFLENSFKLYRRDAVRSVLDIGCGSGRHAFELARRGYGVLCFDKSPQMIGYVKEQIRGNSCIEAQVMDMGELQLPRKFDAAICMMDTFRFLLSDEDIKKHLSSVAAALNCAGLYVTDFWVPADRENPVGFCDEWVRDEDGMEIKTIYRQYRDTLNSADSTFDDELIYEVKSDGTEKRIATRAKTRLLFPEDFQKLVSASGFDIVAQFPDFDIKAPWRFGEWRLISVLRKRKRPK